MSTSSQRSSQARLAAHSRWAKHDPVVGTAAARSAFLARFEREVDPDGILLPAERARRAEHAKAAHFTRMARRSAEVRAARSGAR